jgi:signal transduction histidine kinase/ligand-binding sensor domain-containing protein/DNA-binding response OmpR family regulator
MFSGRLKIRNALIPALVLLSVELHCQSRNLNFAHLDINSGLSHNQVNCIYKDSRGFMWFGTMSGLNRFDGYTFKKYRHNPDDSSSINDSYISLIKEDHLGRLWINTRTGLNIYDPETETFSDRIADYLAGMGLPSDAVSDIYKDREGMLWLMQPDHGILRYDPVSHSVIKLYHDAADSGSIVSNDISAFVQDQKGDFWAITHNGILQHINGTSYRLEYKDFRIYREKGEHWLDYQLFIDKDNDVWIYASNYSSGIYLLKTGSKALQLISTDSGWVRLNNNTIKGIVQDSDGLVWIGTDHGGINLINKHTSSVEYLISNPYDSRSLNQNSITSLFRDDVGIIWAGTYKKGINYYHPDIIRFGLIKQQTLNPSNFRYDDVNTFCEDDQGNLWIGTNGGGLIYFNRKSNAFTHYQHDPADPNSLGNDVVISLFIDRNRRLWIGTFYGGLDYFDGRRFHHYRHNPSDPESLADDRVWKLYEDAEKRFWVGTLGGGLDLLDPATGRFKHYNSHDANSVGSDFIFAITEDRKNNLWIGTADGISILDKQSGIFRHIRRMPGDSGGLSNNNVVGLVCDSRGWIWVGTREGLNLYNPQHSSFVKIDRSDGLADNTVLSILEDDAGNLWMATAHGLSNIVIGSGSTPDSLVYSIQNYDEPDGLQGKEFNERAACKTRNGELLFGGAQGFNIFRPRDININRRVPQIVFTGLDIYNTPVKVNEKINGRIILKRSIAGTDEIVLKSGEKMFTLEFAALDYFQPGKNHYKYRLEGFDNKWMESDAALRKATYTNLNPGSYAFRVIASNNDGTWNETGARIAITVLPPFWKSRTAFVLYFLAVALLLFLLRFVVLERERMKFRAQQEKQEADRRHEIDMLKIKFITNISHEFRTPLSLIITPMEKILRNIDKPELQHQLSFVYRNARRLLNLVNQLLDFRRLEFQQLKIYPSMGDIVAFAREITGSFSDLAEKKNITLRFETQTESLQTLFDHDKVEKIIFNLLSNAFKFTPEKGKITVTLSHRSDNMSTGGNGDPAPAWVMIGVADTGIGIPKEKQEKVFEQFFQDETSPMLINQGTGIGLSLVSEFVKLHKGKITLESEVGKGSCFTVMLPVTLESVWPETLPVNAFTASENSAPVPGIVNDRKDRQTVLIVEDNDDFLFYLKDNLKARYTILEASDGITGLRLVRDRTPDLVVSDIMMPGMDGIELCRAIKNDKHTSHIPVILLTARTSDAQRMEGFETGADEYITKPFSFEILESRIKNLIHQRETVRKSFQKRFELTPSEIKITSLDEKLIQKALAVVENNMSNPGFSVDRLAKEIGMSRVHLYKKLTSLTGKSPIEFIRVIRLRRAARLLEKSQMSIAEIAYQVGFNNPKYFARYFREEYHMLPSEYASKITMDTNLPAGQ